MNPFYTGLCAIALLPTLLAASGQSAELEQARQATAIFAGRLKSELVNAMQSGGAIEAIDVCHTQAEEISRQVSLETGMDVSRVSARNRNPGNAANEWQLDVLDTFETRSQSGESPSALTWSEVVETPEGKEFRFMKAIPTAGLCLQCHGKAIAPGVAASLTSLYPADQAVGYSEGDIRGAFLVTRRLD